MRLNDLEKWGTPPRVIEQWRQRQGESLLPVQSRAVRKGLLGTFRGSRESGPVRMIISAPTSSGKSFCAELAAVKALTDRRKTVMLFPLKSLAEQKFELFQETYDKLGVKCLVVTGDHPENDGRFIDGDYQIAVAIYEKFDLLLTSSLDALKNIGLVVVDEIQTVSEPGRGAILERLLTKVLASVYEPSLVGLSAVIGDNAASAGRLARWLGATLVEEPARPVDLVRGVAAEGSFRFRSFNSGLDGSEPFVKVEAGDDRFGCFVRQMKADDGSTLVFLKSRMETVDRAFKLAAVVDWAEAKDALKKLSGEEASFLIRSLRQALSRGVAFHNSDLSPYQRAIVEQAFIKKEVKVLFSTTTLALGVNLWADTVYLETVKYSSGTYDSRPSLVPVSRAEFDNMTGRAGRLGVASDSRHARVGRAIVLAETDFDRDILWENYIAADEPEPMRSAFASVPLEDWLLNMVVSGLLPDSSEAVLNGLFSHTLCAVVNNGAARPDFESGLERLATERLIAADRSTNCVTPTALGQAVARTGLMVRQAIHYRNRIQTGYPQSPFGWTALALSGPDWQLPPSILSRFEQVRNAPLKMLYENYEHLIDEVGYILGEDYRREPLSYRKAASLKALLLLEQWRQLVPVQKLEEQFQMHLGQIMALGETAAHLVSSIGLIVEATDRQAPLGRELKEHGFSLRFGMPASLRHIHEHLGRILNRLDFLALQKAGVETLEQLCEELPKDLGEDKLELIREKIGKLEEEAQMDVQAITAAEQYRSTPRAIAAEPESVEIDGSFERERYLVRINGFPVRLTGKSFKYFTKLAWWRLHHDSGWIYKEDIEIGFNQARYLYRMKGEISSGLNIPWSVVENNRLGYYRLNVDPSKIRINIGNLKNHPDYELRSLTCKERTESVN